MAVLEYSIISSQFKYMGNHNAVTHARRKQSKNKIGINSKNTLKLASSKMGQNDFAEFLIRKYVFFIFTFTISMKFHVKWIKEGC